MSVRAELKLAVLALAAIQVLTSFGAIGLIGGGATGAPAAAGAWSMVLLALVGVAASAAVFRRLHARLAAPIDRLDAALAGFVRGDGFRRPRLGAAPPELERIGASMSSIMDAREGAEGDPRAIAASDRAALLHLLDGAPAPTLVVDRHGIPTAAGTAALARLAADADGALGRALRDAAETGRPATGVAAVTPIAGGALFVCALS